MKVKDVVQYIIYLNFNEQESTVQLKQFSKNHEIRQKDPWSNAIEKCSNFLLRRYFKVSICLLFTCKCRLGGFRINRQNVGTDTRPLPKITYRNMDLRDSQSYISITVRHRFYKSPSMYTRLDFLFIILFIILTNLSEEKSKVK